MRKTKYHRLCLDDFHTNLSKMYLTLGFSFPIFLYKLNRPNFSFSLDYSLTSLSTSFLSFDLGSSPLAELLGWNEMLCIASVQGVACAGCSGQCHQQRSTHQVPVLPGCWTWHSKAVLTARNGAEPRSCSHWVTSVLTSPPRTRPIAVRHNCSLPSSWLQICHRLKRKFPSM